MHPSIAPLAQVRILNQIESEPSGLMGYHSCDKVADGKKVADGSRVAKHKMAKEWQNGVADIRKRGNWQKVADKCDHCDAPLELQKDFKRLGYWRVRCSDANCRGYGKQFIGHQVQFS